MSVALFRPRGPPPLQIIRERRWLVAALQDRVMQIGRVSLARIEGDDDVLAEDIDHHILHAANFYERWSQPSHALITILAFRRNFYRFQNGMIGVFRIEWIARFGVVWSLGIHRLYILRTPVNPRSSH